VPTSKRNPTSNSASRTSRTVSLKGDAAGAFVRALRGDKPKDDDESYARLATFIHAHMKLGEMATAKIILQTLHKIGLEAALLSVAPTPPGDPQLTSSSSVTARPKNK
jgi:hypothetical protein